MSYLCSQLLQGSHSIAYRNLENESLPYPLLFSPYIHSKLHTRTERISTSPTLSIQSTQDNIIPSNTTCPAILHIRDFIDRVEPDPTRPGKGLSIQLRISLNIPQKDIQSDDVEQAEIPTLVRFFNKGNQSDRYKPNAFIYSSGSFLTTLSDDEEFHILLHAHNLDRSVYLICYKTILTQSSHPGNKEDTQSYFMHCPEAAQPIVTFLGFVLERGGQLNGGPTLLHYRLQTTIYNTSTRTHHTFPITTYFKNSPRQANFPPMSTNTHVFLTGRVFGLTKEHRQLAVVTDDLHFLPTPNHYLPATPSSTSKQKRVDRQSQRTGPQTPTRVTARPRTESLPTTHQLPVSPEIVVPDDEDKEGTPISWPETANENPGSSRASTPPPETFSKITENIISRYTRTKRISKLIADYRFFYLTRGCGYYSYYLRSHRSMSTCSEMKERGERVYNPAPARR